MPIQCWCQSRYRLIVNWYVDWDVDRDVHQDVSWDVDLGWSRESIGTWPQMTLVSNTHGLYMYQYIGFQVRWSKLRQWPWPLYCILEHETLPSHCLSLAWSIHVNSCNCTCELLAVGQPEQDFQIKLTAAGRNHGVLHDFVWLCNTQAQLFILSVSLKREQNQLFTSNSFSQEF